MIVDIINRSTLVTQAQAREMVLAVDDQAASDFAPAWGQETPLIQLVETPTQPAVGGPRAATIYVVDTIADVPAGVLGYHTEGNGAIRSGFVAVKPELDNGAQVLTGDWSVASVLSHEVLELLADPSCSFWANDGAFNYALEVCDPVEAPSYTVDISSAATGPAIAVSNFVLPSWFDPYGVKPFDHLGLLHKPFTLLPGGYVVRAREGQETQVFGAEFPDWRRQMKDTDVSRTARRLAQLPPPL